MTANSFGSRLVLTTFGESHGAALGAVIEGVPAGVKWDEKLLNTELGRRRPGQSKVVSARSEGDVPEVLSGVYEGKTLGTPIAILVRNVDQRSEDYRALAKRARRGHADDVWKNKFGHSDPRGGGRSSGRETVARVMGGAVAKMIIKSIAPQLRIVGFASQIGPHVLSDESYFKVVNSKAKYPADSFVARYPSKSSEAKIEKLLLDAKRDGQSYGGKAVIWIDGVPSGLGQPVFHKMKADLASAFMGVGATSGVEIGAGFEATEIEGTDFHTFTGQTDDSKFEPEHYGGIRGGITTGERIKSTIAFKPTSSILDIAKKGRHDPCIVPRAIPVLESMAALVIADHLLWIRTDRIRL